MRHTIRHASSRRRGAVLPLVALCMLGIVAILALAIDIGMIAIARSQCQNAADAAATAGVRTINGDVNTNYNLGAVPGNAVRAAVANRIFSSKFSGDANKIATVNSHTYSSGEVKVEVGAYAYRYDDGNAANEKFELQFPRVSNEPYTAVRATVQHLAEKKKGEVFFSSALGWTSFNTVATAVAVHRPRDVIIIMDLSGSMRFQSLPGIPTSSGLASPSSTNRPRVLSMNPESIIPEFGHYADTTTAALKGASSYSTGTEMVDPANISAQTNSGPPILEDFFQNAAGTAPGSGNLAFKRAPDSQNKTPGGYNYLKASGNTGASYAATVNDIVGGTTYHKGFEQSGYDNYVTAKTSFYTEGPGYWGKTFFVWPPDPRGSSLDPTNSANHANNGAKDWRQRFFFKYNTGTSKLGWLDHNNILFNPSGAPATNSNTKPTPILRKPGDTVTVVEGGASVTYTYRINYAAIFHWLKNETPKPFPERIRAGRIKYYDSIPDPSDTNLNNRFWTTATLTNLNERFWKSYIDFVLGLEGTGAGTYTNTQSSVPLSSMIGNGDFYQWGTVKVSAKPDYYLQSGKISNTGGYTAAATSIKATATVKPSIGQYIQFTAAGHTDYYKIDNVTGSASPYTLTLASGLTADAANSAGFKYFSAIPVYMDYTDNPYRPRHQFWFGPMTWVDWLGNYNTQQFWWPGNVHEAQCWACKVGIQTAIEDIKNNHPNDFIGLAFFSSPKYAYDGAGQHNSAVVPLGRSYDLLIDSLWFPPTTITGGVTEITPYDADFDNVPRSKGGTGPGMGFMIAYNLLSSSSSNLRFYSQPQPQYRGAAGGLGRRGAQRVVIFETDGAPNTRTYADLKGSGTNAYYQIRMYKPATPASSSNTEWPDSGTYADSEVFSIVDQICKLESDSGHSTLRRPAKVYSIGYGSLFDPSNPSTEQTKALGFLQTIAFKGNTAASTDAAAFPDSRRIYGTNDERVTRISNIITEIMQDGVTVSLIQ